MLDFLISQADSDFYWFVGFLVLSLLVMMFGWLTTKHQSLQKRKSRMLTYILIGSMVFTNGFIITGPYTRGYSQTDLYKNFPVERSNSAEAVTEYEKQQNFNIEVLRGEVDNLRAELYKTNLFYRWILFFLLGFAFITLFDRIMILSLRKKRKKPEII